MKLKWLTPGGRSSASKEQGAFTRTSAVSQEDDGGLLCVHRSANSAPPQNLVERSDWSATSIGVAVLANGTKRSVHTDALIKEEEEFGKTPSARELLTNGSFFRRKKGTKRIPAIIECSFKGDLVGVTEAIMRGEDVNTCIDMDNRSGGILRSVTPLFLAAQKNRSQIAKLLVSKGANPVHQVYYEDTKEHCTAAQAATLNMHLGLAIFLAKAANVAKKKARKERKGDVPFDLSSQDQLPGHFNSASDEAPFAPLSYQPILRTPEPAELDEDLMNIHDNPLRCRTNGRMDFDLADDQEANEEAEDSYEAAPPPQDVNRDRRKIYFNVGFTLSGRRASH